MIKIALRNEKRIAAFSSSMTSSNTFLAIFRFLMTFLKHSYKTTDDNAENITTLHTQNSESTINIIHIMTILNSAGEIVPASFQMSWNGRILMISFLL